MRVVHVMDAMGGGTKKHLGLLASGLVRRGVQVALALPLPRPFEPRSALMDYGFPDAMRSQGLQVRQFHMIHGRITPAADARAFGELVGFFRRERFDVVHTHSAKAGVLGRTAARVSGVPAVVHTPYSLPFRRELDQGARYWLYYALERFVGSLTDVMIATSRAEYAEITSSRIIACQRVRLIFNCFDLHHYRYRFDERSESKKRLGWADGVPVVGTVARLSPQKGLLTMVEAAALIAREWPQVRFVVVGEGEQRSEIQQRVERLGLEACWIMPGQRSDYLDLMAAFDVFAFPSLWEGLPYAPLEAMAIGIPVVGTAVVGTTDLITHEENGLLVPSKDAPAMATAILRLLGDQPLSRRLAGEARAFVEAHFNGETPVEQTLDAYERALNAKGRRSVR